MQTYNNFYTPYVLEQSPQGERSYDLFSRLLKDRIIIVGSEINEYSASVIVSSLLFLQADDPKKDIKMFINSPGGNVTAGLGIYDTMQILSCDIQTTCFGQAASMGAVLLAAGTKGKRYVLENARVMIHQPWGGAQGTASEIAIQANEIKRLKLTLNQILAHHTSNDLAKVQQDSDRDYFMGAQEAVDYGMVDEIMKKDSTKA